MSEFDAKWKRWAEVSYSKAVMKHIRKEFMEMFALKDFTHRSFGLEVIENVYDAGCGLCRYFEFLPKGTHYLGHDLSGTTVDLARKRYSDGLKYFQAYRESMTRTGSISIDLVIAVGTIHHCIKPDEAFRHVAKAVKPGGVFCFSVYAKKSPMREAVDDAIRSVTTKMHERDLLKFIQLITDVACTLRMGDKQMQEEFYYGVMKAYWNKDLPGAFSESVNYDWYKPEFASRHTQAEVLRWVGEAGLIVESVKTTKAAHWVRCRREG